jgi:hypothetical protein
VGDFHFRSPFDKAFIPHCRDGNFDDKIPSNVQTRTFVPKVGKQRKREARSFERPKNIVDIAKSLTSSFRLASITLYS